MADNNDIKYYIPAKHLPATIIAIKTSPQKTQSEGDELIEYEYKEQVEGFVDEGTTSIHARRAELRASKDGVVGKIRVSKGETIDDDSKVLLEYEGCDHDTQYEGICVVCCKTVPKNLKSHVNMTHDATSLSVSRSEAKRLEEGTVARLIDEGKLSLIVDLDQTLIHATVGTAIDDWVNAQGEMPQDIRMFPLPDSPTPYYIKLRPHLEIFLEKLAGLYELHIYTMGTRNYAAAVANVIDPDGKFFSQRILSRDENADMTQKSIERLFPCDDSMVVVIDDRADVWRYSPNLVKVHPYEYFVGTGDINAGHLPKQQALVKSESAPTTEKSTPTETSAEPGLSSTEALSSGPAEATATTSDTPPTAVSSSTKTEESTKTPKPKAPVRDDNDDELKRVLETLETIHEQFYDAKENFKAQLTEHDADVKTIITEMKKGVLKDVNVLFSSVIPLGQAPERTDIWRQALSFGAKCSHDLTSRVTHVVAAKPGTAKVMKARRRNYVYIVRPEWLYDSIAKWQRQDESKYLLADTPGKSTPISTTPPPLTEGEADTGIEDEEDQGSISEGMDENHRPLSMDNAEVTEHLKSVNWDDMEKEVEDAVGDMDESDFDSDTSARSNTQSDASTDGNKSPLINLKRTRIPRKSGLGASVMYGSSDDEDDNDSARSLSKMDGIQSSNGRRGSIDSGGEIDEESGSDDGDENSLGGDSEAASDADTSSRTPKRRRVARKSGGNGLAAHLAGDAGDVDGIDADDEITMDHSASSRKTRRANDVADEEEEEDDDEDDDDFLNDLENDIDAQLNEEEEENGEEE